ncbi:hypothetical protein B0T10DRAFT_534077 [Thelonectria olida]|uniref:BZIP domain-containing protein n=1 Tax=Thelonectria olida TaxID=1576542 RepID=A0A9P9AGL4_9HYPO|nr:hypothetical protein B0T10DRAFT_534077 [Thelonectria olida]
MSRNSMAYQPPPSQLTNSSFFDEAVSIEAGLGFLEQPHYITESAQPTEPKNLGDGGAQQNILPTDEGDKKPARRTRNRRQSQAISVLLETSASGLQGELDDNNDFPKDPHRRRILEHNRTAATKCRLCKREESLALACRKQSIED